MLLSVIAAVWRVSGRSSKGHQTGGVGIAGMPAAEVAVDESLVRALLEGQHPDLAGLPLSFLAEGWDNVMFRLGPELLVRLPRREASAQLVLNEQRVLPTLASRLPLAVPEPLRVGVAAGDYPWHWHVVRWVPGERAAEGRFEDPVAEAVRLGSFLAALHQPAPPDAPTNPYRGVPLVDRDAMTRERVDQLAGIIDAQAAMSVWEDGLAARPWAGAPLWLHGDLHPANLIVEAGVIAGVIDWGDVTSGDPATDLSMAWMLFDGPTRARFRSEIRLEGVEVDDDAWRRARAWAVSLALAYLAHSADNPTMGSVGQATLAEVLGEG